MSTKNLAPVNIPSGTADPTTPTFRGGDLFFRTDTGRIRVYTGSVWTDAGIIGATGPSGAVPLASASIQSFAFTNDGTMHDITGWTITVPAGVPFVFELDWSLLLTWATFGVDTVGTFYAKIVDTATSTQQCIFQQQYVAPHVASLSEVQQIRTTSQSFAALASPTTYKVQGQAPNSGGLGVCGVYYNAVSNQRANWFRALAA